MLKVELFFSGQVTAGSESSPLTSPLTVRALLGPVSPIDAAKIQLEWKKSNPASKILRLADPHKGLERQGRFVPEPFLLFDFFGYDYFDPGIVYLGKLKITQRWSTRLGGNF